MQMLCANERSWRVRGDLVRSIREFYERAWKLIIISRHAIASASLLRLP